MKKDKLKIKVKVDTSAIDKAIKKVDELLTKLQIKELKDEIDKLKKEIGDIKANYLTIEKLTNELKKSTESISHTP